MTIGPIAVTPTAQGAWTLTAPTPIGNSGAVTYQWYRGSRGFAPGAGNLIAGQTTQTLAVSGLVVGSPGFFACIATDSSSNTAVASVGVVPMADAGMVILPSYQSNPVAGEQFFIDVRHVNVGGIAI